MHTRMRTTATRRHATLIALALGLALAGLVGLPPDRGFAQSAPTPADPLVTVETEPLDEPTDSEETSTRIAQPASTEASFFTTNGVGNLTPLSSYHWGRDWFRIVPVHFPGFRQSTLLFYNRTAGTAQLRQVNNGNPQRVIRTYAGWRPSWNHIVPVRAVSGEQHLFFYDRYNKLGRTYRILSDGTLIYVADMTLGDYDLVVAGDFYADVREEIALYSRNEGRVDYCLFHVSTGVPTCSSGTPTEKKWDIMLAGNFTSAAKHEIVLWDRDTPELWIVRPNGSDPFIFISQRTDLPFSENKILVAGEFGGNASTDLLIYDPRNDDSSVGGMGSFYLNDGNGTFGAPVLTHTNWRKTWSMIIAAQFSTSIRSTLLFYDDTRFIDVLVVRGANDDGSAATQVSSAQMDAWVAQLNRTFATAGLRFQSQFASQSLNYTRFNQMHCSSPGVLKDELSAWAQEATYTPGDGAALPPALSPSNPSRRPRLLIYLPAGLSSTQCSSTRAQFVLSSGNSQPHMLTHEVGHFFSLPHVFNTTVHLALKTAYSADSTTPDEGDTADIVGAALDPHTLDALDADGCGDANAVCDTPPDPGPYYWPLAYANFLSDYCDPSIEIPVTADGIHLFDINPDRFNLMTYRVRSGTFPFDLHTACPRTTMTFEQARRARYVLHDETFGKTRLIAP